MPRSAEPTRERLVDAAFALFTENGFARTTVEQITRRACVSQRTFFRHFPDKEEVLFADDDRLLPTIIGAICADDEPVAAEELMADVLGGLAAVMTPDRNRLRARQQIVDGDVALTGRELAKQAQWQPSIAAALVERGFQPHTSDLLAAVGFTLFRASLHEWLLDYDGPTLRERVVTALPDVRAMLDEVSTPT
ncbi:TetR family transcriptional regulator [Humibacillus xanthopallidus]|uniref:TetR family transcriptional regulator n=1 Tax=Humibacillus xanthopallidus TaxID=412689 RepID=A0A543PQP9_9MICO|nr:TetR/AcrR family transcriptional regulator [Humibacillus xanthopallidus]TQN46412.1 TetR family transcriptional regulator [Humibacillus xanthopallidus]